MLSLQEIPVFCPPSLCILIGMAMQALALFLRCRPLLVCGALTAVLAAFVESDITFIIGQLLLLPPLWRSRF